MKVLTPVKAMRAKCVDCCGGAVREVARCELIQCPLWPYRMGHRPNSIDVAKVNGSDLPLDGYFPPSISAEESQRRSQAAKERFG